MKKIVTDDMLRKVMSGVITSIKSVFATKTELTSGLSGKSNTNHNHDNVYYTETEMNTKLGSKSDVGHNHNDLYFTESEMNTKLAAKAELTHNHDTSYYKQADVDSKLDAKANATHQHNDYFKLNTATVDDFNNIKLPGIYSLSGNIDRPNSPIPGTILYGTLEVVPRGSDVVQRVSLSTGAMFIRYYGNDAQGWRGWIKVFTEGNKPTWDDVTGKPSTFNPSTHSHDDRYFTETEMNTKLAAKADNDHNHDDRYFTETESDGRYMRSKAGTVTDFNKAMGEGMYYVNNSTSIPNAPFVGGIYGTLLIQASGAEQTHLLLLNTGKMFVRFKDNSGAFTAWVEMYSTANKPTWDGITGKPSTFTPESHTHDDRYFTEAEMNTKLGAKSDTNHNHDERYFTETEVTNLLNGKIPSGVSITREGNDFYLNY